MDKPPTYDELVSGFDWAIAELNVEPSGEYGVSSAETMLGQL